MSPNSIKFAARCLLFAAALLSLASCGSDQEPGENTMTVTATAYNSTESQTDSDPATAAWGDTLKPGMKAIAVSRDLLDRGLTHRTSVKIEGLPGEYLVLDKMNKRWTKKIDIYMGADEKAAQEWGKRQVLITWKNKPA